MEDFERNRKGNLYKIWNRMSSGSYSPPPVRTVKIPKASGGERKLGIPTVSDRIAQQVVKSMLEPVVDPLFHPASYGYRPGKAALDAVGQARQRCWRYDWIVDLDIKGFFDNIPQDLLMRAVKKHAKEQWMVLYIERWLEAPVQEKDGQLVPREKGTPQGGVISPLLANLFLHYAFDRWMTVKYPQNPFERFADDAIVHGRTEEEAQEIRAAIAVRWKECGLELHPEKTKIVYGKDEDRRRRYEQEKFDFLGYTFRPRRSKICLGCSTRCFGAGSNITGGSTARRYIRRCVNWIDHGPDGLIGSTKSCADICAGRRIGSRVSRDAIRSCGRTGSWVCGVAPWREPYELRGSRTVLREARGAIPRAYAPQYLRRHSDGGGAGDGVGAGMDREASAAASECRQERSREELGTQVPGLSSEPRKADRSGPGESGEIQNEGAGEVAEWSEQNQ